MLERSCLTLSHKKALISLNVTLTSHLLFISRSKGCNGTTSIIATTIAAIRNEQPIIKPVNAKLPKYKIPLKP